MKGRTAVVTGSCGEGMGRSTALRLAREALRSGGRAPTILNAANEVAVERFLAGGIGFLDIARVVEETLNFVPNGPLGMLEDVHATDEAARHAALSIVDRLA